MESRLTTFEQGIETTCRDQKRRNGHWLGRLRSEVVVKLVVVSLRVGDELDRGCMRRMRSLLVGRIRLEGVGGDVLLHGIAGCTSHDST